MSDLLDRLGIALLDATLASTAIAGFVVLAIVQCRQPARRRGWARAGLLASLALIPLAALNPFPRLDLRGPIRSVLDAGPGRPDRPPAEPLGGGTPGPPACPAPGPGWWRWSGRALTVAYLGGLAVGLGVVALGAWGSALLVRSATAPTPATRRAYLGLPAGRSGRRPRLLVSPRAGRPVLLGMARPTILIPPELDRPEEADRLRLGLLHELSHAGSGDHLHGLIANLAQATWFFLPPIWWIRDQMKLDQEFLADRGAVAHYGTSGGYASSLLDLASRRSAGSRGAAGEPAPAAPAGASSLFLRVLMLLRCPFAVEGETPIWWRWLAASALGLATLSASCLTLRDFLTGPSMGPAESPPAHRRFHLPDLAIGQAEGDDRPFDLRVRLPEAFELTLEVLAGPDDLAALEVLGHRLGAPSPAEAGSGRAWHRVRIRRDGAGEEVEVDGRPVVGHLRSRKPAPWLSVRPLPGQVTRIRELDLIW